MAKKVFLSDIDLALNQLLQAKLENLPSDPTGSESRLYYNTVIKKIKYYNGTVWLTVIDDLDTRLTNARTPTSHVIATATALGAEHTISGAAVGAVLRASSATAAAFQKLSHADFTDFTNGTDKTHAEITTHVNDATKHRQINDSGTANTELFSASKILQLFSDLNTTIAGSLVFKGGYNATTDLTDTSGANIKLDSAPIGSVTQGWTYVVTVAGTFFSEDVQVGDMIIAKQTTPTTAAHWTIVNKNIPDIVAASETAQGIIELATQAEVNTGTDAVRAVTPATLKSNLGITSTLSVAKKFTQTIGDGTTLTYPVTHGLASAAIVASVHQTLTPFYEVECEIVITSTAVVTFNFNVAPTTNLYTVTIIG